VNALGKARVQTLLTDRKYKADGLRSGQASRIQTSISPTVRLFQTQ
jgi:hypothetical protein